MGLMSFITGNDPAAKPADVAIPVPPGTGVPVATAAPTTAAPTTAPQSPQGEAFWNPSMTDVRPSGETATAVPTSLDSVLSGMSSPIPEGGVSNLPSMPDNGAKEAVVIEDKPVAVMPMEDKPTLNIVEGDNPESTPSNVTFSVEEGGQVVPPVLEKTEPEIEESSVKNEEMRDMPEMKEEKSEMKEDEGISVSRLEEMHTQSEIIKAAHQEKLNALNVDLANIQKMITERQASLNHITNIVQPKIDAAKKKLEEVDAQRATVVKEAEAAMKELAGDQEMIEHSQDLAA